MGNVNYKYNEYHAAIYAALGPMAWCLLFVWIIFTTQIGNTSKFLLLLFFQNIQNINFN